MSDAEGVIAKFQAIPGSTPKGVLDSPLRLPAVLNAVALEEEAGHSEYDTIAAGQFSQAQQGGSPARKLRALDLETLTLDYKAAWLVTNGLDPAEVKGELQAILRAKKPVTLILAPAFGEEPIARMNITFRTLREEHKPQESDTIYFTIGIKEWRTPSVSRKGSTKASRKHGVKFPTTKKLDSNDTLQSLAHAYYGSPEYWRDIRDANGITKQFGQSTALVTLQRFKVGSVIKLPKVAPKESSRVVLGTKVAV